MVIITLFGLQKIRVQALHSKNLLWANCNKCPLLFVAIMVEQFVLITSVLGYSRG